MSLDSERCVLAPVVFHPDRTMHEVSWLKPEDFNHPLHREVFRAAVELERDNHPIDDSTIRDRAKRNGYDISGTLVELAAELSLPETAPYHAKRVAAAARRRRWRGVLSAQLSASRDEKIADDDFLESAESAVVELARDGNPQDELTSAYDVAKATMEILLRRKEKPGAVGVPIGFGAIDGWTNGWQPGDLVVIAARPGMGKTALAMQGAAAAGFMDIPSLTFSLEMPKEALMERLISAESGVDSTGLRTGRFPLDQFRKAEAAASRLSELPLHFDDRGALALRLLCSQARRWRAREAKDTERALVIVDYLQLVETDDEKEYDQVTRVSKALKALAKELKCPVVALSQLNRECEKRSDKRPMMADLRASGQIEQDADVVAFLYRDEMYTGENCQKPGVTEFIIGKSRSFPGFTADLGWRGATTSFYPLATRQP